MRILLSVLFAGLLVGSATSQRLVSWDAIGGVVSELQPPTALLPGPSPIVTSYAPAVPLPPGAGPAGDATFDNVTGLLWYTDGMALVAMPTPTFAPLAPVPPPIALAPAVMAAIGGPATGIALDPFAGIMFVTSVPGIVVGIAPIPGTPIVVAPFPIPFAVLAPTSGLEWDGATGSLWSVSVTGVAYNFFPGGVPALPPVFPPIPMPGAASDIAIDKLGTLNGFGLRPLYVLAAGVAYDTNDLGAVPFPAVMGPMGQGLAFMNHPAQVPALPGCEGCPGISLGPTAFTTSVMSAGNGAFSVGMGGMMPGTFGLIGFDTVTGPVPFTPLGSCPLGLTLSATLILTIAGPADPAGDILMPLPLAGVPIGAFLQNQNVAFCGSLPVGFAFSRLQTITVGGF